MNRENVILGNTAIKKLLGVVLALGAVGSASASSVASLTTPVTPLISSGDAPDSPGNRVDPNVNSSRFSGVVSLAVQYDNQLFICSGTLVGKRQVVTAGHCLDTNGNGSLIDLNKPGSSVRVVFNAAASGAGSHVIGATKVSMHADYAGFGNCPAGVNTFCVNDDVAVVTLGQDAPADAKIYKIATTALQVGSRIVMAGYGWSGDGINGFTVGPNFRVKRSGENHVDIFDGDDENGFGGKNEVWYGDFDGGGRDTSCAWGWNCAPGLANDREAGIGKGDSGGPSFIEMYGELMLIATNTFGGSPNGVVNGAFGSFFGGMVLKGYLDYIDDATGGTAQFVPEPTSVAVFGLGLLALAGVRRRKQQK
ncbi:MAG: sorting protein [Pseudoduganella sp.]|jgi:secreted trypsin-like serine protease|nr:sorting protein [Pseudoduganella sp.]